MLSAQLSIAMRQLIVRSNPLLGPFTGQGIEQESGLCLDAGELLHIEADCADHDVEVERERDREVPVRRERLTEGVLRRVRRVEHAHRTGRVPPRSVHDGACTAEQIRQLGALRFTARKTVF